MEARPCPATCILIREDKLFLDVDAFGLCPFLYFLNFLLKVRSSGQGLWCSKPLLELAAAVQSSCWVWTAWGSVAWGSVPSRPPTTYLYYLYTVYIFNHIYIYIYIRRASDVRSLGSDFLVEPLLPNYKHFESFDEIMQGNLQTFGGDRRSVCTICRLL